MIDKKTAVNLLEGALGGMAIGAVFNFMGGSLFSLNVNEVRVFERDDGPNVMRLYRKLSIDGIIVYDSKLNKYIPFKDYLSGIENKADRIIEEGRIKKSVGWYDK